MPRNQLKNTGKRNFKVLIYESEYRQIQAWVDKYQHLETGGDLFGLWSDERTAVVQLVLGPGKGCKRTSVSFYQNVEYLSRVGNQLTSNGLCHIGEWHSHHRLGLTRPSGGDENTVWSNMDRYDIRRFFLFIATINANEDINVGAFLFEIHGQQKTQRPVLQGEFVFIQEESPLRIQHKEELEQGAESVNKCEDLNWQRSGMQNKPHGQKSTEYQLVPIEEFSIVTEELSIVTEELSMVTEELSMVTEELDNINPLRKIFYWLLYFLHDVLCPICLNQCTRLKGKK